MRLYNGMVHSPQILCCNWNGRRIHTQTYIATCLDLTQPVLAADAWPWLTKEPILFIKPCREFTYMTINITWHFYCLVTNSQLVHVVHHKWPRQAVCTPATGRELTHTLNLTFLYVTVSTLNPTVGMVVTDWPSFNLYRMAEMESRALILETHTHTDTNTI